MRYWDSSALVPLCVQETTTARARALARKGPLVTWCMSQVEIASAVERRAREGALSVDGRALALRSLSDLSNSWTEITAVEAVRERAIRLLATQPLRAADALQMAAALVATGDRPSVHDFICLDQRLREAALREGFRNGWV